MTTVEQKNNEIRGEFIASIDGNKAGLMTYTWAGEDKIIIDHTEVEAEYNGKGVGKDMVYKAVEFAREKNLKVIPLCPFANATFKKNADIQDVL